MRHQVKGRKLGRSTPHRKATLQALAVALIKEQRIQTTLPKAKELRTFIEPIITKAKDEGMHNRRQVFAKLQDKYAVKELYETVMPAVGDRPGGYTRIVKLGTRLGDAAQMAVIELVDFNDVQPESKEKKKKRTRRAGKSAKPAEEKTEAEAGDVKPEAKKEPEAEKKPEKKSEKSKEQDKAEAKADAKAEAKTEAKTEAKAEPEAKAEKPEAGKESAGEEASDDTEKK